MDNDNKNNFFIIIVFILFFNIISVLTAKLIKGLYKNTTIALQIIFSAKRSNLNTRYNKNKECYRNEHTLCFHYLII